MKNSKKLFLVTIFVFVSTILTAQQPGYGIRAGINLSSFGGNIVTQTRIGLYAGTYYNKTLFNNFAIQPEAGLSLEGDDNESFTNLNIGIMGKYNYQKFMFEFGPQFGFILSDDNFNSKHFNFTIGMGAGYALSGKLILGIRYNAGSDVSNEMGKITNNTFSFNAFFAL